MATFSTQFIFISEFDSQSLFKVNKNSTNWKYWRIFHFTGMPLKTCCKHVVNSLSNPYLVVFHWFKNNKIYTHTLWETTGEPVSVQAGPFFLSTDKCTIIVRSRVLSSQVELVFGNQLNPDVVVNTSPPRGLSPAGAYSFLWRWAASQVTRVKSHCSLLQKAFSRWVHMCSLK